MNVNIARKRSGSSSKRPKEKVVFIYEQLFRTENPLVHGAEFWDEFFLLVPNIEAMEFEILKINSDTLGIAKDNICLLFTESIKFLETSDNPKRVTNAFSTLCGLFSAIYRRSSALESGFDIINAFMEFKDIEEHMKILINQCSSVLTSESAESPRNVCLRMLLILVCGTDLVSENILLEYVMVNSLFDSFIWLLSNPVLRTEHGHDTIVLLILLVNYRKYEGDNPYVVQLSILADELALNGFGQVISTALIEFCKQYALNISEVQAQSWFSSLSTIVGNMFVSDEGCDKVEQIRANNALLLALYEATNLNRNFITTLAHTQTDTSSPPSPSSTLKNVDQLPDLSTAQAIIDPTQYPTNLFVALFQYCSIVMQEKDSLSSINLKLVLLILTLISEDAYANAMMYDLTFEVMIKRSSMRHRKLNLKSQPRPLASTLFDLLNEFIVSHLISKKFPMENYLLSIGIMHRLLVYQKRFRIRLGYNWRELWSSLICLLKFLVYQEQTLVKKINLFSLSTQVINIFNLFITFGDTFLATTNSYDELYYELNREEKVFSEMHAMALRYSQLLSCEYKEDAKLLSRSLVNIIAILNHFQQKIKEALAAQNISTPSEEQILDIIRKNYDLTLKFISLDHYERYAEKPTHIGFFTNIVKEVVQNTRKNIFLNQ